MRELTQEELGLISGGYSWDDEDIIIIGPPPVFPFFPPDGPSFPPPPPSPPIYSPGGGPPPPSAPAASYGGATSEQTGTQAEAFIADFNAAGELIESRANAIINQSFTTSDGKSFSMGDWKSVFTGFTFSFVNQSFAEGTGGQSFEKNALIGNNYFGNYGDETQNWLIIHETAHQLPISKQFYDAQFTAFNQAVANGTSPTTDFFKSSQFYAAEDYNNQIVYKIADALQVPVIHPVRP